MASELRWNVLEVLGVVGKCFLCAHRLETNLENTFVKHQVTVVMHTTLCFAGWNVATNCTSETWKSGFCRRCRCVCFVSELWFPPPCQNHHRRVTPNLPPWTRRKWLDWLWPRGVLKHEVQLIRSSLCKICSIQIGKFCCWWRFEFNKLTSRPGREHPVLVASETRSTTLWSENQIFVIGDGCLRATILFAKSATMAHVLFSVAHEESELNWDWEWETEGCPSRARTQCLWCLSFPHTALEGLHTHTHTRTLHRLETSVVSLLDIHSKIYTGPAYRRSRTPIRRWKCHERTTNVILWSQSGVKKLQRARQTLNWQYITNSQFCTQRKHLKLPIEQFIASFLPWFPTQIWKHFFPEIPTSSLHSKLVANFLPANSNHPRYLPRDMTIAHFMERMKNHSLLASVSTMAAEWDLVFDTQWIFKRQFVPIKARRIVTQRPVNTSNNAALVWARKMRWHVWSWSRFVWLMDLTLWSEKLTQSVLFLGRAGVWVNLVRKSHQPKRMPKYNRRHCRDVPAQ